MLSPTQSYVALLSASGLFSSIAENETTAVVETLFSGSYPGGQFVFADNGDSFSDLMVTPWLLGGGISEYEAHFEARFTPVATVVPEPSAIVLLAAGLIVLAAASRTRSSNERSYVKTASAPDAAL